MEWERCDDPAAQAGKIGCKHVWNERVHETSRNVSSRLEARVFDLMNRRSRRRSRRKSRRRR
jgi:hypothetical protein